MSEAANTSSSVPKEGVPHPSAPPPAAPGQANAPQQPSAVVEVNSAAQPSAAVEVNAAALPATAGQVESSPQTAPSSVESPASQPAAGSQVVPASDQVNTPPQPAEVCLAKNAPETTASTQPQQVTSPSTVTSEVKPIENVNKQEQVPVESKEIVGASETNTQTQIETNANADSKQAGEVATTEPAKTETNSAEQALNAEKQTPTVPPNSQVQNPPQINNSSEETKGAGESVMAVETPEVTAEQPPVVGGDNPAQNNQNALPQPNAEPAENGEAGEEMEQCVNIDELTEHVMNIINEGMAEEHSSQAELQKKNMELQQFIVKLIHLLKEKTDLSINLERQNSALISQAKSLKDVIAITKDLLGIRNMEIEHLHQDLDSMQENIKQERVRHNTAVQHLNEAMGLNDKLKAEYLTQMDLFEKLKSKYTEKVVLLTRENIRLNALMKEHGIDTAIPSTETPANQESTQSESVDK